MNTQQECTLRPFDAIQWKSDLKPGDRWRERGRESRVEVVGTMWAMVYHGRGDLCVIPDRPYFCTEHDVLARVIMVHRCGTDVKILARGRPVPLDDSLLGELGDYLGIGGESDPECFRAYADLVWANQQGAEPPDRLFRGAKRYIEGLDSQQHETLRASLRREWGRVLGHEMVVQVEHVGSKVKDLTDPLGYTETEPRLSDGYLDFQVGERLTVQTRVARYQPPPAHLRGGDIRGVQLLNQDHQNMAMELDGAYAEYLRLTPEMIQSGSLLRVPSSIPDVEAALVEPAACLLDCLDLGGHPEAQGPRGNIMKKGVKRGGHTAVIGSGAMAFMAAQMALHEDELIEVGGAAKVTMLVRSEQKAELGRRLLAAESRIDYQIEPPGTNDEQIVWNMKERHGPEFGFDDVILAAGDHATVALAHKLVAGSDWRIHAFAGTRGPAEMESGLWHYGNAGTHGTSGCNAKAMENVIGMIERGFELEKFSGRRYTLPDLHRDPSPFFTDTHLRPLLLPVSE